MKKWKIIKNITCAIIICFIIYIISHAIRCINMDYPHEVLGILAKNWTSQFIIDLVFILLSFGIFLIIDIIVLILATQKIKKLEKEKNEITNKRRRKI